jgi:EmrB/QacA subfamily drug resistance transporter
VSAPPARCPTEREVLTAAALGTMLMPLNSTMVAVALPDVVADLGSTRAASAWLVSGYLIAQAALQPLSGKLGDRFGRRPLILYGLASFGLASLGASLAPTLAVLIVFRILQAITGALVFPNALGLIRQCLPEDRRGRAFGTLGSAIGVAAAAGPPLGGALVELGGWRTIFLVNVPWIAVALWFAYRSVPQFELPPSRGRFDVVGGVGLTALLAGAAWLMNPGDVAVVVVCLVAAILAGAGYVFVRYELRRDDPMLQPRFLRVRAFAAATASVGLGNLSLYATLLAVPVLLSHRGGWTDAEIGLTLAAMSLPMAAMSPVGGWLSDQAGRRFAAMAGIGLLTVALAPLALSGADVATPVDVSSLAFAGAGLGLSNAPVQAAGVEALDPGDAGVAAGIFMTGRYLGGIAAASLVAGLASAANAHFGLLFSLELVAALLALLCASALPGREPVVTAPIAAATRPGATA